MSEQVRGKTVVRRLTPGRHASDVVLVEGDAVIRVAQPGDPFSALWVDRAKTARGLEHPSLTRMRGAKPADPTTGEPPFVAAEFIDGPLLADVAAALDGVEASRICRSLAGAVKVLHDGGLAHGRIYDRQVRLRADQTPVLLDVAATWGAEPTKAADITGLVKLAVSLPEGQDTPAWESLIGYATTIEEVLTALNSVPHVAAAPAEDSAPASVPAPAPLVLEAPVVDEPATAARRAAPVMDLSAPALPTLDEADAPAAPNRAPAEPVAAFEALDAPALPADEPVVAADAPFNPYESVQESAPWGFDPLPAFGPVVEPAVDVHAPPVLPADDLVPFAPLDVDGPVPILQYDPAAGLSFDTTGATPPPFVLVDDSPVTAPTFPAPTEEAVADVENTAPEPLGAPVVAPQPVEEPEPVAFAPVPDPEPAATPAPVQDVAPAEAPVWEQVGSTAPVDTTAPEVATPALPVAPAFSPGQDADGVNADVLAELAEAQRTIAVLGARLAAATASAPAVTDHTDAQYAELTAEVERARRSRDELAGQVDDLTTRLTAALEQSAAANAAAEAERALSQTLREDAARLLEQVQQMRTQIDELTADLADAAAAHARASAAEAQAALAAEQMQAALDAAAAARADLAAARAEATAATEQVVPLTGQIADLTARLVEAQHARAAAEDAKAQFVAERAASVRQSLTAVERTGELEEQAARLTAELEGLRNSTRQTRERADAAVAAAQERADAAIAAAESRAQVAKEEMEALRRLTTELSTRLASSARPAAPQAAEDYTERDQLRTRVAELEGQAVVAQGQIAELNRQLEAANAAVRAAQAGAALAPSGPSPREQALRQEVEQLTDQVRNITGERNVAQEQLELLRQSSDRSAGSEGVDRLLGQINDLSRDLDRTRAKYEDAESRYQDLAIAHASASSRLRELQAQHPEHAPAGGVALPPMVQPVQATPHAVGPHPIVPTVVLSPEVMAAEVVPGSAHSFPTGGGATLASLLRQMDPEAGPQS